MKLDDSDGLKEQQKEKNRGGKSLDVDEKSNIFNKIIGIQIAKERKEMIVILFLLGVFFLLIGNPLSVSNPKKIHQMKKEKRLFQKKLQKLQKKMHILQVWRIS